MTTVKRRIVRAGGWGLIKRIIKPIPIIGSVFALGLAGYEIRKKGLLPGVIHVGLDVTPVVGTTKGIIELFTGDLVPDKEKPRQDTGDSAPQITDNGSRVVRSPDEPGISDRGSR